MPVSTHRLYHDLAELWPLLSPPADYIPEAEVVRRILHGHLPTPNARPERSDGRDQPAPPRPDRRPALLEFGAGGGHTLCHLRDEFECVAVDLSEAMLANCRRLAPEVETIIGDMRSLRLGRTFEAVLIHDAIDYMLSEAEVKATLDTAAAHLAPGGLALIAPTYTRETFENHQAEHDQHDLGERTLTCFEYVHDPDPNDTTFELILVYLINDAGEVRIEPDRHICGLFDEATWLRLMREAGFDAQPHEPQADDPDWPLYVGIKR